MMSLQSALVGFAVFKVLPARFVRRPLSVKENVRSSCQLAPETRWLMRRRSDSVADDRSRDRDDAAGCRSGWVGFRSRKVATKQLIWVHVMLSIVPALSRLTLKDDGVEPLDLTGWQIVGWCLGVAFFGCASPIP